MFFSTQLFGHISKVVEVQGVDNWESAQTPSDASVDRSSQSRRDFPKPPFFVLCAPLKFDESMNRLGSSSLGVGRVCSLECYMAVLAGMEISDDILL